MKLRTLTLIGACVALAMAACATNLPSSSDIDIQSIEGMAVLGVVDGTVVELEKPPTDLQATSAVVVQIDSHRFDLGDHYWVDGSGPYRAELPQLGSETLLLAPQWVSSGIETGASYSFAIVRSFTLGEEDQFPWQVRYAFGGDGELVGSGHVAMTLVSDEMVTMRIGAETDRDAALAYLEERRSAKLSEALSLEAPATPRADSLSARREGAKDAQREALIGEWATLPASDRQLPHDVTTDRPVADLQREALGIEEWHPWTLVVLYDETSDTRGGWAAIQLENYGYIGPTMLDPASTIAVAAGYGPTSADIHAISWAEGEPITRAGGPGDIAPEYRRDVRLEQSGVDRAVLDGGGAVLLDLRSGATISVIDQAAFVELLVKNSVPTTPGPEE